MKPYEMTRRGVRSLAEIRPHMPLPPVARCRPRDLAPPTCLDQGARHVLDGSAIKIGTDEFISLNRVAKAVLDEFGWRPPGGIKYLADKPVGVVHRALDGAVAKQRTGWMPRVPFELGLQQTVEWYVANNEARDVAEHLDRLTMQRK